MGFLDGKPSAEEQQRQMQAAQKAKEDKYRQEALQESRFQTLHRALQLLHVDLTKHDWQQDVETFTNAPKIFERRGLPYNGVYCSDGQAGKKLTITVAGGPTYTVTLAAGLNVLNLPDECQVTTQSAGDTETVLVVWSSHRLS